MAAPTKATPRPGRTLAILAAIVVALGVWTWWPSAETHSPKLGLDLRGGTQVILTPKATSGQTITDDQLNQTVEIIRQRVDGFGVAESEVTTQGSGQNASIIVSIPGATNQTVLDSLATTAKLDFRPVLDAAAGGATPTASPTPTGSATPTPTATGSAKPTASASAGAGTPSPTSTGNPAAITGGLTAKAASASPTPTPSPSASPTGTTTTTTNAAGITSQNGLPPIQSKTNDAALQAAFIALDCSK